MSYFPCELGAPAAEPRPTVEWEEPDCLLCGSRHWANLVEASDNMTGGTGMWFAVVQCQKCGLCFTNPRPTRATIDQFYPADYRPHHTSRSRKRRQRSKVSMRIDTFARRCLRWFLPRSKRRALSWHGKGRLLDFGCSGGRYLERMHRQGWHVTGLDLSATAVQRIRKELGLKALVGSLPHPQLQPASFDVISMWQSLEHVHNPLEVLKEARHLLVPGGKLLVSVPNIDSLPFRWFGHDWYGLDLPRHLTHFTARTLTLMLDKAGFCVGPMRMERHSDWLRSSAKLAVRNPRGPYWHRWLVSKHVSRLATWYTYLQRQTDCLLVGARKR